MVSVVVGNGLVEVTGRGTFIHGQTFHSTQVSLAV